MAYNSNDITFRSCYVITKLYCYVTYKYHNLTFWKVKLFLEWIGINILSLDMLLHVLEQK